MNYDDPSVELTSTASSADAGAMMAFTGVLGIVMLVVAVVGIIACWKVFVKAGKPGWAALVPVYNLYVLNKIVGRPDWFFWAALGSILFSFIGLPVILVFQLIWGIDLAKSFGRSTVFGVVGLFFFSLIGWLMLGFGKDKYVGPSVTAKGGNKPTETPAATPAA